MSQYLVLSKINVQNANSIAGLTWGFPAITQFLGFTHSLNRKLSSHYDGNYSLEFSGCAVVSHAINNKVYQPKKFANFEFLQSKNPPVLAKHKNSSPPIIEEGKLNFTVSLIVEFKAEVILTTDEIKAFEIEVLNLCYKMRIAGGNILNIQKAKVLSASTDEQNIKLLRQVKRLTMPGFILLDRSHYLKEHYQKLLDDSTENPLNQKPPELLDAWLDFAALKYKATSQLSDNETEPDDNTNADWHYVPKPKPGYLVPLMIGYKAISDVYSGGEVENTRDLNTASCFVEAVHSVGEWKGVHSLTNVSDAIWRYQQDGQWYLCRQATMSHREKEKVEISENLEQTLTINEALNKF